LKNKEKYWQTEARRSAPERDGAPLPSSRSKSRLSAKIRADGEPHRIHIFALVH
jgi:hypothetical protein